MRIISDLRNEQYIWQPCYYQISSVFQTHVPTLKQLKCSDQTCKQVLSFAVVSVARPFSSIVLGPIFGVGFFKSRPLVFHLFLIKFVPTSFGLDSFLISVLAQEQTFLCFFGFLVFPF
jgi:hypothetical protein